ncbi:MAG TPA: hypothetical protein PKA64_13390, partial [Myxococcota bacterium]|nr:hypothetical protein [Myxococcota bacterium]
ARRVRVVGAGVELADADADPWSTLADDLEDYRRGLGGEAVLAVALDEVPWWLEELERTAPGAARAALASLRALRDSGRWSHLRWIFTGSVGIAGRASSWGASAELNDLQVQVVPPLDRAAARHLLRLKTDNPHLSDDVCDAVSHLADRRPHWIEVIGARLPQGGRAVAREDVERASEALLTRHMRNQFDDEGNGHFHRRYTSDERSVVRAIFDVLSERGQVSPENGVVAAAMRASGQPPGSVRATISRLCDDFYLTEEGAGVRLSLPLFARWWTRWGEL